MPTIKQLEEELLEIKERNRRVETDKAWETSWTRRTSIALFTYSVAAVFLYYANFSKPFLNAALPASAYMISTMTLHIAKNIWTRHIYRK